MRIYMSHVIALIGMIALILFVAAASYGCSYSAKQYLSENVDSVMDAGVTCIAEKPDEYTLSFGWTFRRDQLTGEYQETSMTYVTVGVICKKFKEGGDPEIYHSTVTCDVTKSPSEHPCDNLIQWEMVKKATGLIGRADTKEYQCQGIDCIKK